MIPSAKLLFISTYRLLERIPSLPYGPEIRAPRQRLSPPQVLWAVLLLLTLFPTPGRTESAATNGVKILAIEGDRSQAQISRANSPDWDPAYPGQILRPGDRGRTGTNATMTLRLSDLSVMRIAERGLFTIKEPPGAEETFSVGLWKGLLYLFHRDKPGSTRIDSRTATAATRGTEFIVAVDETTGEMDLAVLAGEGELSNAAGSSRVKPGEEAIALPGAAPRLKAAMELRNGIQWVLYYPGILDLRDLPASPAGDDPLTPAIQAYAAGDIRAAFASLPPVRSTSSDRERLLRAALHLAIGQADQAEGALSQMTNPSSPVAGALRRVIAVVREPSHAAAPAVTPPNDPTGWLAESYSQQAGQNLEAALEAARRAVALDAEFGYGWIRVAELEFGFGRSVQAEQALARGLTLSPKNAQGFALRGFLSASRGRWKEAEAGFDHAIELDGSLSNGWLGRGLAKIRSGKLAEGREDLQTAAAMEPQRGVIRSYLAKAWQESGDLPHAGHELELAKQLDSNDPTAWLYSALLNQQHNRFNQAIRDLEQSKSLNENRAVYRSRLLLDQDRAVRGANLAGAYEDAGLRELGVNEAARAVASDYANFSAHLFLANSYASLRDAHQINQRYESPWLSEYLVANLLAPASAGTLSQTVSQQEYSRFFERDGFGLVSTTEYLSRGDWTESAAQYGRFAHMSYSIETSYRSEHGQRPNEDLTSHVLSFQFKQEFTPQDSVYVQAIYADTDAGDLTPYYDPARASRTVRQKERQEPLLIAGYHHEWSPGVHTLLLAGRLSDDLRYQNPAQQSFVVVVTPRALPVVLNQSYQSRLEIYTAELQHLIQREHHTWVAGTRVQFGEFNARNDYSGTVVVPGLPFTVAPDRVTEVGADFSRISAYLYDHWELSPSLLAVGGVSYDHLRRPLNHRFAPLTGGEETIARLSPKVGLVYTPTSRTTVRAGFSRSLGGVSFDQSFQLEPSQVAGFNQTFRSVIPESVASANSGAEFQMSGISLEHRVTSNTWVGVTAEWLTSDVNRSIGAFDFGLPLISRSVRQRLGYEERSLSAYLYQMIGQEWSLGGRYRVSHSQLDQPFTDLPASAFPTPPFESSSVSAQLHELRFFAQFQHPAGFFASAESLWRRQHNYGYVTDLPGDDFWQFNLYAGYRLPNRRAELRLGLLNLANQDYRLNPLNITEILPRSRTLAVSLRLNF